MDTDIVILIVIVVSVAVFLITRLDRHRRLGRHHRQDCRILFFFQGQPKPSTLAIQLLHAHVTSDRHFPGSFASGHPQRAPQGSRTQEHTPGKFTLPEFGVI